MAAHKIMGMGSRARKLFLVLAENELYANIAADAIPKNVHIKKSVVALKAPFNINNTRIAVYNEKPMQTTKDAIRDDCERVGAEVDNDFAGISNKKDNVHNMFNINKYFAT